MRAPKSLTRSDGRLSVVAYEGRPEAVRYPTQLRLPSHDGDRIALAEPDGSFELLKLESR